MEGCGKEEQSICLPQPFSVLQQWSQEGGGLGAQGSFWPQLQLFLLLFALFAFFAAKSLAGCLGTGKSLNRGIGKSPGLRAPDS